MFSQYYLKEFNSEGGRERGREGGGGEGRGVKCSRDGGRVSIQTHSCVHVHVSGLMIAAGQRTISCQFRCVSVRLS